MAANGLKRLDLWIPHDHPVFTFPPRSRARIAREWLDLGARLSVIEQELRDVKRFLLENEPGKKAEHEKEHDRSEPGNSVSIDDFI